jgi:hypothetical protein
MSSPPKPSVRVVVTYSDRPSGVGIEWCSLPGPFTFGPRFLGTVHLPSTRRDVQMSLPPKPPGRVDVQKAAFPSAEKARQWSMNSVLTGGSPATSLRLRGCDQTPSIKELTQISSWPRPPSALTPSCMLIRPIASTYNARPGMLSPAANGRVLLKYSLSPVAPIHGSTST